MDWYSSPSSTVRGKLQGVQPLQQGDELRGVKGGGFPLQVQQVGELVFHEGGGHHLLVGDKALLHQALAHRLAVQLHQLAGGELLQALRAQEACHRPVEPAGRGVGGDHQGVQLPLGGGGVHNPPEVLLLREGLFPVAQGVQVAEHPALGVAVKAQAAHVDQVSPGPAGELHRQGFGVALFRCLEQGGVPAVGLLHGQARLDSHGHPGVLLLKLRGHHPQAAALRGGELHRDGQLPGEGVLLGLLLRGGALLRLALHLGGLAPRELVVDVFLLALAGHAGNDQQHA